MKELVENNGRLGRWYGQTWSDQGRVGECSSLITSMSTDHSSNSAWSYTTVYYWFNIAIGETITINGSATVSNLL